MRNSTNTTTPINHRKLNEHQIEILLVLYKFRFATAELISRYQNQLVRYSNARLKILLEQEYIGRNYDSSYRIKQRPATYYLLPRGIHFLKTTQEIDSKGLHLSYNNHKASSNFINHWLRIFRIYLKLDELYGDDLELYTSSELAEQDDYPKPRPDAFLAFGLTSGYALDVIESNKPSDRIRAHILRYIKQREESKQFSRVLLVCDNIGLEREVQRILARTLTSMGVTEPAYYTTTLKALYELQEADVAVWASVLEPDERVTLTSLS